MSTTSRSRIGRTARAAAAAAASLAVAVAGASLAPTARAADAEQARTVTVVGPMKGDGSCVGGGRAFVTSRPSGGGTQFTVRLVGVEPGSTWNGQVGLLLRKIGIAAVIWDKKADRSGSWTERVYVPAGASNTVQLTVRSGASRRCVVTTDRRAPVGGSTLCADAARDASLAIRPGEGPRRSDLVVRLEGRVPDRSSWGLGLTYSSAGRDHVVATTPRVPNGNGVVRLVAPVTLRGDTSIDLVVRGRTRGAGTPVDVRCHVGLDGEVARSTS